MYKVELFDNFFSHEIASAFRSEVMSRIHFAVIFLIGVVFSYLFLYLSEYFKQNSSENVNYYKKSFSLLPKDYQLKVIDEGETALFLRKTEVSVEKNVQGSEKEALTSLHAALEMKLEGKNEKALRLFKHATVLAPKHPDILNHYGEFLEETQNDVMLADQMYFQALLYCPDHTRAFGNRQRTARLVEEIDGLTLKRIDGKRDQISGIPDSNKGIQRAKKEAYFQHIYHTVGIEGNTMSLAQTRSIVETQMAIGGKSIMEHNEILGLDAALKYINATLVNRFGPIRLKDILEIHRRVLGYVDPFGSGEFRRTQVYVGGHIPPSPNDIPPLMNEFEQWLNSENAVRMHPIRYAALAHYKLVRIHPFDDGNGRTSRLLMNAILMQAGFPPVIILKQDRHRYYEYLQLANEGDIRPFVRFIAECTEKTLDMFLWATKDYFSTIPALDDESHRISFEAIEAEYSNITTGLIEENSSNRFAPLEMSRAKLFKLSQFFKANPECIRANCVRNCEYLVAYKLRRGQQVISLYRKLWGEVKFKQMINQIKQRLIRQIKSKNNKLLMLSGSVALFDWNKNRIDEKLMRSHYLDLDYINYLTKLTITCNICHKRLVIDTPRPDIDYCTCPGTKPVYNKKFGTCPWMPFLERQDLLIWRKEQESTPGLYEYKVYGFYKEVRADMFLQVQLDIDYRKTWDLTAVEIKLVDSDPFSNSNVLYWEMQWPKFFSNRDYVFNRRYIIDPVEKVIVITNHITEHPSAPESPQKFRVKDYQCNMVIKPVSTFDQPGVKFCMTYYDNPGLSIPGPVQTWVATSAMPDFLSRLRSASIKYCNSPQGKAKADGPCKGGPFSNLSIAFRLRELLQSVTWINNFNVGNLTWVNSFKSYLISS